MKQTMKVRFLLPELDVNHELRFAVMVLATWLSTRCSKGRAGSIPVRSAFYTIGQMVELVDTRLSKSRSARSESSNLSLATYRTEEYGATHPVEEWMRLNVAAQKPRLAPCHSRDTSGSATTTQVATPPFCRRAGTQLAFIRPICSVQFRSLQLSENCENDVGAAWEENAI